MSFLLRQATKLAVARCLKHRWKNLTEKIERVFG
jgi:hypothetical protein